MIPWSVPSQKQEAPLPESEGASSPDSPVSLGVPGTSIVMLTLTLSTAGLPLEGIGYIVAIDRIIDMMRTATNVTGQMLVPVLVAKEEKILDEDIYDGRVAWLPGDPDVETIDGVRAAGI